MSSRTSRVTEKNLWGLGERNKEKRKKEKKNPHTFKVLLDIFIEDIRMWVMGHGSSQIQEQRGNPEISGVEALARWNPRVTQDTDRFF